MFSMAGLLTFLADPAPEMITPELLAAVQAHRDGNAESIGSNPFARVIPLAEGLSSGQ